MTSEHDKMTVCATEHKLYEFLEMKNKEDVEDWDYEDVMAIKNAMKALYYKMSMDAHEASHK